MKIRILNIIFFISILIGMATYNYFKSSVLIMLWIITLLFFKENNIKMKKLNESLIVGKILFIIYILYNFIYNFIY